MMTKQKSQQRGFKGIWIPKEIWLDHSLSLQEKVFLVEIESLDLIRKAGFVPLSDGTIKFTLDMKELEANGKCKD